MRRALFAPLALALSAMLLLAPTLVAQEATAPPEGATLVALGGAEAAHWIGDDVATVASGPVEGSSATLWIGFRAPAAEANGTTDGAPDSNATDDTNATDEGNTTAEPETAPTYRLQATVTPEGPFTPAPANLTLPADAGAWAFTSVALNATVADAGVVEGNYTLTLTLERVGADGNVTVLATQTSAGAVAMDVGTIPVPIPTPPVGIPTTYYIVGGAAAVAVAIGGALAYRSKQERDRRARQPRRSAALREEALERAMTTAKRPEEKAAVVAEIREQEKVRERRRELQILDAKKADVLKSMDLLQKRHEAGGLTKLQYDTMVKKRQQELERIESEIAQMEAQEDQGGTAAA